jgi:hypothetical protein
MPQSSTPTPAIPFDHSLSDYVQGKDKMSVRRGGISAQQSAYRIGMVEAGNGKGVNFIG